EQIVDLAFVEIDGQVIGPIAGALLVANGLAFKLVAIAECLDEIPSVRFVVRQATVARKLLRARHLDEDILETPAKPDQAIGLALPGDHGFRAIEIGCRRHHGARAPGEERNEYRGNGESRTIARQRTIVSHSLL